ncbi:hypothetical protein KC19_11G031700 [Ceratodon purpureus]|uniref:Uncharacterized protein n=1 Tax=Ceratodon purpureus TaxID=3225 RepID=A0A8T0GEB0_CERPU|nr:hypothetical protein KC19_11G031700 [Ceratodon purpureus]
MNQTITISYAHTSKSSQQRPVSTGPFTSKMIQKKIHMKLFNSEMISNMILAAESEIEVIPTLKQQNKDTFTVKDSLNRTCTFTRLPFLCNTFRLQLEIQTVSWLNSAPATNLNLNKSTDKYFQELRRRETDTHTHTPDNYDTNRANRSSILQTQTRRQTCPCTFIAGQGLLSHTQQSSNCTKHW